MLFVSIVPLSLLRLLPLPVVPVLVAPRFHPHEQLLAAGAVKGDVVVVAIVVVVSSPLGLSRGGAGSSLSALMSLSHLVVVVV